MAILQELADIFPLSGLHPHPERPRAPALSYFSWTWLTPQAIAAALFLAVAVFLGASLVEHKPEQDFVAAVGEQSNHQLNDGSSISLNTDSHISVEYNTERRVVRLLQGEASFNVAHDPDRPFVVYAGNGMVWAVGTAFNVRYTSDVVDVLVTEGTVKVFTQVDLQAPLPLLVSKPTTPSESPTLEAVVTAGESLQYLDEIQTVTIPEPVEVEQKLAWQQGALIFKGEPLEQVLREASRYTEKKLIISDPSIRTIPVGGHFKTSDIDGLLASLGQGFGLKITEDGENRVFLSENPAN